MLVVTENLSSCTSSDEQVLRKEFNLPKSVRLMTIDSRPNISNFRREGLKIDATFKFSDDDFNTYQNQVKQNIHWNPLPLSNSFLIKITGVGRMVEYQQGAYEFQGKPTPEHRSIYNPTKDYLLEEWKKNLPLDVKNGFYRCLTAGDNLMYTNKVSCSEKPGDLNDFMLAVLDLNQKTLRVKVHTAY